MTAFNDYTKSTRVYRFKPTSSNTGPLTINGQLVRQSHVYRVTKDGNPVMVGDLKAGEVCVVDLEPYP